jgi:hypothetical protein
MREIESLFQLAARSSSSPFLRDNFRLTTSFLNLLLFHSSFWSHSIIYLDGSSFIDFIWNSLFISIANCEWVIYNQPHHTLISKGRLILIIDLLGSIIEVWIKEISDIWFTFHMILKKDFRLFSTPSSMSNEQTLLQDILFLSRDNESKLENFFNSSQKVDQLSD